MVSSVSKLQMGVARREHWFGDQHFALWIHNS